ncbi:MAG: LamG domain-containing protein [Planctomycetota bacterium]|jgi:hypothetical protein
MAEPFDPYYVWLGIPPERQPPHHYDLLGVQLFEQVPDVIRNAVDQRMAHLRTFQTGKRNHFAEKLLNQVAAAKLCLLNPEKKAAYDEALRARLEAESYGAVSIDTAGGKPPSAIRRWAPLAAGVVGGVALLVAGLLVWGPGDGDGPADPADAVAEGENTVEPPEPKALDRKSPSADDPAKAKPDDFGPDASKPPPRVELSPKDEAAPKDEVPPKELLAEPPEKPSPPVAKPEPKPEPPPAVKVVDEPPPAKEPLPVPSEQVRQEIAGKLDEIYNLAEAKTSQRRLELAGLLVSLARQAHDNPAEHYVLLDKAMELATAGGDAALAVEAAEATAFRFDVDLFGLKHKALLEIAGGAIGGERIASFVKTSLATVDEALAGERFDAALEIVEAALRACQRSAGREHRKRVFDRRTDVQKLHESWRESQEALATLKENPGDPEANLVAGRWYCFSRGDWEQGIAMLALGSDEAIKAVAIQELKGVDAPENQVKLGDAWKDLAQTAQSQEKDSMLSHAGTWYRKAKASGASGLTLAALEQRLKEIEESGRPIPVLPEEQSQLLDGAVLVMTFEPDTFTSKDGLVHVSDMSGCENHGVITGATPSPAGKAGGALQFDGREGDVLLRTLRDHLTQGSKALSISVWVFPVAPPNRVEARFIFDVGYHGSRNIALYYSRVGFTFLLPGRHLCEGGAVALGRWHHVVGVWDGAKQAIYVNGEVQAVTPAGDVTITPSSLSSEFARLGAQAKSAGRGGRYFPGLIDEVAVFTRALSDEEIATLLRMGVKGQTLTSERRSRGKSPGTDAIQ